jgi:primosomal protein N' (replication factor Y)
MILGVAIDTPLRRTFDYRPPADASPAELRPGHRIWVPFGRRREIGVIVECRDTSEVPAAKLRTAIAAIDAAPVVDNVVFQLLLWSADYYRHPVGEVIAAALPAPLRTGAPANEEELVWRLTELGRDQALATLPKRALSMRRLIEVLGQAPEVSHASLVESESADAAVLRKLEQRGYVERQRRETGAQTARGATRSGPVLGEAQRIAVDRVVASFGRFTTHLLFGVTGSGKTEVYLRAIAQTLSRGEQALVLVPEIALTPQLIARFRDRFEAPLAVLHSGLSDGERLAAWRRARSGTAPIVIGTRSAVFVPLSRPGLLIVDEEHDASFKQQEGFRYSARDLAIVRAQRHDIPIVLGSATPSLESIARARRQPEHLLSLPQRAANALAPRLELIDLRQHAQTQGISTPAMLAMRRHLEAGAQVLLFLNRRGYAPVLFCPMCGWSAHCHRCDAHLTLHQGSQELACHHCDARERIPPACPNCGAPAKPAGQGTQRIEETLVRIFPAFPLARIDRDSMRRKGDLEATLAKVANNEIRILVGTQMLTKGHDFPNVTLVVVLNADQGLFSTDFRASERLAQTIVQVAGRAGRAERPGEVLIQTEYPEHPLLSLLLDGGYEAFATGALAERERIGWPPYARIALVRAEAAGPGTALKFLDRALELARSAPAQGIRLLGPAPAPMERRAGHHRAQLLLHASSHTPLQRFMSAWLPRIETLPEARRVRWSIDVDPAELF